MRRIRISFASAVLLAVCNAPYARAELVMEPWDVFVLVSNSTTQRSATFIRNENPFAASHTAQLGSSSATAFYDFAWLLDDAHFDITTSHHLAQLDGETITSGRIYLTPSVDSLVTFSGDWQFMWPSAAVGTTRISLSVWDLSDPENGFVIANASAEGGNFDLGPPFGSLSVGNQASIHAGGTYMMSYLGRVRHYDPTPPGTFGEASGDFHFTISPIPEPAAGLLALAALTAPSVRRRPRCVPMA